MRGTPKTPDLLPVSPENYPDRVPSFTSEAEEQEFWATHSSAPYHGQGELVFDGRSAYRDPDATNRSRLVVSIPDVMSDWLQRRSEQLGVTVEDMVSEWIDDRALTERTMFGDDIEGRRTA